MKQRQNLILAFYATALIMLSACSPSLSIKLNESGRTVIDESEFTLMFSPTTRSFAEAFSPQGQIFDAEKIAAAFSELGFPRPTSVDTSVAGNVQLLVEFQNLDIASNKIFSVEAGGSKFFVLDTGKKTLTVNFNKEIVSEIVSALPKELFEYSDLMMAPILTGENISEEEYTDLISSAYGTSAGRELRAAFFKMKIECPGQILRATALEHAPSGTSGDGKMQSDTSGDVATFTMPVSKMLTLANPVSMEVIWK